MKQGKNDTLTVSQALSNIHVQLCTVFASAACARGTSLTDTI